MSAVLGYNILLKKDSKSFAGVTQDDLSIDAEVKESITKEDAGNKKYTVTGHNVSFSVTGIVKLLDTSATAIDRDDIIALALTTGDDAEIDVVYSMNGADSYQGSAIVESYKETSNSEEEATYTLNMRVTGAFTKVIA